MFLEAHCILTTNMLGFVRRCSGSNSGLISGNVSGRSLSGGSCIAEGSLTRVFGRNVDPSCKLTLVGLDLIRVDRVLRSLVTGMPMEDGCVENPFRLVVVSSLDDERVGSFCLFFA